LQKIAKIHRVSEKTAHFMESSPFCGLHHGHKIRHGIGVFVD